MFALQATCVLQKRHLPDIPIEYLVKGRNAKVNKISERWVPVDDLLASDMGAKLIELFEQSKVGHQAVNAHLPKRRSLGMANGKDEAALSISLYTNITDHSQELPVSQQYCAINRPDPRVNPGHDNNSSPRKCQFLNRDAFSELNSSTCSSEPAMMRSKYSKSVCRRNKLCRSLALRSRRAVTNRVECSQVSDDTAGTENINAMISDSDSDDNIRYSLVETNCNTHGKMAKQDRVHLNKDVNSKKTDCEVNIDNIAMKKSAWVVALQRNAENQMM